MRGRKKKEKEKKRGCVGGNEKRKCRKEMR